MALGIPPQAYTRDTMNRAFKWFITQPESVRHRAKDPDAVVALFMHAQKYGDPIGDPVDAKIESHFLGSKEFKEELKDLAEGLNQFSEETRQPPSPTGPPAPSASPPRSTDLRPGGSKDHSRKAAPAPPALIEWSHSLHPKSVATIRRVQARFGLNSEMDAINLLITVGYERLHQQLPDLGFDYEPPS
jgi:hypothetical protein